MKRVVFLIGLVMVIISLKAQNVRKEVFDRHLSILKSTHPNTYTINVDTTSTSVVFSIDSSDSFEGSYLILKGDTIQLSADDENRNESDRQFSQLISLYVKPEIIQFCPAGIKHEIDIFFIDARMKSSIKKKDGTKKKSTGCSIPGMIDQSEWRSGLPDPVYDRINQKVMNVIIHHTDGSNTDTNYTQTVRDIYVYHTQVRGWSDIGYNYLIAPNGDIYEGRDPGTYEQDNVMGAHFCNNNHGTMGISMMGTFTDIVPTDTAFQSLITLVTWKLGKEQLDPLGIYSHPLNSELPAIAGHRDGCATECPGNSLYAEMDSIRKEVMKHFNDCNYSITGISTESLADEKIKIVISNNTLRIICTGAGFESVEMYDIMGRLLFRDNLIKGKDEVEIYLNPFEKGLRMIRCKTNNGYFTQKVLF